MHRVLIVEDDADIREMVALCLIAQGYETDEAPHGLEALAAMQVRRPCVVVLDMQMPVMSGWQFLTTHEADPDLADVPVICYTSAWDADEIRADLDIPCVSKSSAIETLTQQIASVCGTCVACSTHAHDEPRW